MSSMLSLGINQDPQPACQKAALPALAKMPIAFKSALLPYDEKSLTCPCGKGILKSKYLEARCEARLWHSLHAQAIVREKKAKTQIKTLHARAVEREKEIHAKMQAEMEALKAKIRLRELQLYGKTSERTGQSEKEKNEKKESSKKRGQQFGHKGHGRQENQDLPVKEELIDFPESQRCCPTCQKAYEDFPGTEDSEILEIEVKAHKREIKRKHYRACCQCSGTPGIITAPPVGRLIPQGKIGVSLWVKILLDKYEYFHPTNRLLRDLKNVGLTLPQGTVTDGLKKLKSLFEPVYHEIAEFNRQDEHFWNADETRWEVFAEQEGKSGNRWYLWVFAALKSVVFFIDPTRSKSVPKNHLGNSAGVVVVDRYKAYFVLLESGKIVLMFCWAHVRRDFLTHAKKYPKEEAWALEWIREIRELYYINAQRVNAWATKDEMALNRSQMQLEKAIEGLYEKRHIQEEQLSSEAAKKILISLNEHRHGLEAFLKSPDIPMDNNRGERMIRGPVVGRKGFYGSGSVWSALLAAMMFSLFATLKLWELNPHTWTTLFLQSCADNNGKLPNDWQRFLPWKMDKELRNYCNKPLTYSDTS
jgi:transposase